MRWWQRVSVGNSGKALSARGNCSDLMCPSYSQPVFPGPVSSTGQALTRNPVTLATSNCPYHRHFWIPAPDRAGGRLFAGIADGLAEAMYEYENCLFS